MKRAFIGVALLLAVVAVSPACDDDSIDAIRGSGNVVTQDFELADFTAVEASHSFDVEISRSDTFSVTVRVDDNLLDLLDVDKTGDTLRLRLEPGLSLSGNITLEATVTMPALSELELSGAARANLSGFVSSAAFEARLSGASSLDGDLEVGEADFDLSGASVVTLDGSATAMQLDASGASSVNLEDFIVQTAEINLSGASNGTVNVQERIDPVDVSGASHLRYLGDPALGNVNTSGASTIDKIEP